MADCNFLEKAIQFVRQASDEDEKENYKEALRLYQLSLNYFITALKYEKNEKRKEVIRQKAAEYMDRAEKIKEIMKNQTDTVGSGGSASKQKGLDADENDKTNEEENKMKTALEGAILREKPNVKWSDVAGLESAKEALREAVILPIKFPHMFTEKRKPWRGILLYGVSGTDIYSS
jgi:vacuolar protein-sorting-associated protein 4